MVTMKTDSEIVERANRAGWEWIANFKSYGSDYPAWVFMTDSGGSSSVHESTPNGVDRIRKWFDHDHDYLNYIRNGIGDRLIGNRTDIGIGMYSLGSETESTPSHIRGFGGAKWEVVKLDGTIITTVSLWSNGKIPERFHARLPINCLFRDSVPLIPKDFPPHVLDTAEDRAIVADWWREHHEEAQALAVLSLTGPLPTPESWQPKPQTYPSRSR